jgi:syntaxin 16
MTKKLNKNIRKLSFQLRQELKSIEKNINIYINSDFFDSESELFIQIKDNISQSILSDLNSFSKKFKINQELYSQKCKELVVEEEDDKGLEMNEISTVNSELNDNSGDKNFLMREEPDSILVRRNTELNEIVRGVTYLQQMFKDLQVIVSEQGTILDRIDYNIDVGFDNVSKGKKKIVSANEKHKSHCFRNAILFLQLLIFTESMIILFKFL